MTVDGPRGHADLVRFRGNRFDRITAPVPAGAVSFSATDDVPQKPFRPTEHGIMPLAGTITALQM
jgi:hypothetical protein